MAQLEVRLVCLPQLLATVHEDLFQDLDAHPSDGLLLAALLGVEVGRLEDPPFFRVAGDVGEHGQERRRVGPALLALRLGHRHEFAAGEGAGGGSADGGELLIEALQPFASALLPTGAD